MAAQRKRKAPPTRGEILKMTGKELKSLMRAHKAGSTIGKKDVLLKRVLEFFEMPPLDEGGDLEGSTQPNVETAEGGEKAQLDEGNGGEKDADAPDADAAAAKANDAPTSTPGTPGQFPDVESEENAKAPGEGEAGTGVAAPPETPAADTPKGKRKSKGGDSNARKISELSSEELGALESAWRKLGDDPSKSKRKEIALKFQVDVKSATKHFKKEKGKRKSNVVTAPAEEARAEPPSQQQQTRKISEISAEEKEILMRAFRTSVEASNGVPSKENKEGLAEQLNVPVKEVNQFFAKQRKLAIGRGDLDLSQPSSDKKRKEKKGATADETDDKPGQSETETIESSKKKRKKKDKDENKPKRAKSAYNFFLTQKRSEVKEKYPELDNTAAMKQLGIMWKEASDAEKAPFEAMAKKDKIRYEKEKESNIIQSQPQPEAPVAQAQPTGDSDEGTEAEEPQPFPPRGKKARKKKAKKGGSETAEEDRQIVSSKTTATDLVVVEKQKESANKRKRVQQGKSDKSNYTCTYASFQETYLKGCAWSPCGVLLLSASNDKCMRVYDMPEGAFTDPEPKTSPKALKESVKFSVGGPIYDYAWYSRMQASEAHSCFFAVTSQGSPIQMIDGARGQLLQSYKLHNDADELVSASSLCFHPGGEVLVGGFKGSVATWRLDRPGKEPEGVHSTAAHGQSDIVKALDFGSAFPDLLACGAYDGMVGLYDLKAGWTKMDVIGGHAGGVTQVQFSKDGNFLYSGARRDGAIHCWDIRNLGAPYYTLTRPGVAETNQCIGFDILPMGSHLASGSTDGSVLLYDLVSGDLVSSWKAAADAVNGVSFHPYATLVATASGEREFSDSDSEAEAEAEAGAGGGDKKSLKLWRPASSYQVEGWQSGIARRLGVQLE